MSSEQLRQNLKKPTWQERANSVATYHAGRCREDHNHTIEKTAQELNRSIGRISEDITLSSWMKTSPRVSKFKNPTQALDYIKQRKDEMRKAGPGGIEDRK